MARHKRKPRGFDETDVLRVFKQNRKPLTRSEILRALGAKKRDKEKLNHLLRLLGNKGKIINLRRGAFGLTEGMRQITGTLEVQRSGVGFLICDDKRRRDVFIHPKNFEDARHNDRVVAALMPGRSGKRQEGRIVRVISRGAEELPVRVERFLDKWAYCIPADPRQPIVLMVENKLDNKSFQIGDMLVARPEERVDGNLWSGKPIQRLGREDDVAVQESLVKMNHDVPTRFPASVLDEAAVLPALPSEADMAGRRDLRGLDFVTIDGARAKDFDDAILVAREGDQYRLWVAIADVGHYVSPESRLDREARQRGNSYYFPQSVEPMFPEALSNGLCSLNPDVPRLVMVAEMVLNREGIPLGAEFYQGVIRSKARLTYAQVNRALFMNDKAEQQAMAHVLPMLQEAEKLARALHARRIERGTLDFDLPEPDIQFNLYGESREIADIRPKVRHFGHQLIEEFMIAANEAVARFLTDRGDPCMYRVHQAPDPDKVESLFKLLRKTELGRDVPHGASAKELQQLLAAAQGKDMEYMVNRLTLRTMMQAKYTPENIGHFGLASECYCHFTSPIRRYADLVVHRALKAAIDTGQAGLEPAPRQKNLKKLGEDLSNTERVAVEAEREILKRVTILFLRDKVGDEFTGVINSLADFGFWVELGEVMAEGLVRLSNLHDDYYMYLTDRQELLGERTGRRFYLGQTVKVRLADLSLSRLEVDLELL